MASLRSSRLIANDPREKASVLCKTLSTILNAIQPQSGYPVAGEVDPGDGQLYSHVTTLLTRGTEDHGKGRSVIAVAGARATATEMATDSKSDSSGLSLFVTQNQRDSYQTISMTEVKANSLDLPKIIKRMDLEQTPGLPAHASDILKALTSTRGLHEESPEYERNIALTMELVLRRSIEKIKCRIRDANYPYTNTVDNVLQRWTPRPQDALEFSEIRHSVVDASITLDKSEVCVLAPPPATHHLFRRHGFPISSNPGGYSFCRLNLETAPKLIKILVDVYGDMKRAINNYRPGDTATIRLYLSSMDNLYHFFYHFLDCLRVIVSLPSFKDHLNTSHKKDIEEAKYHANLEKGDWAQAYVEKMKNSGTALIESLRLVLAWPRAVYRLNKSKLFHTGPEERIAVRSLMIQRIKSSLPFDKQFSGAIHCESILMCLAVAAKEAQGQVLQEKYANQMKALDKRIGVGKKCCFVCNLLQEYLDARSFHFFLPGTTGIVFPWAPPFGIPLDVLQQINDILRREVLDALRKPELSTFKSRQSSPASDGRSQSASDRVSSPSSDGV